MYDNDGYGTEADWDREDARERGAARLDAPWVLTDRDVWHLNPFYRGPRMPHPEDEDGWAMVAGGTWEAHLKRQDDLTAKAVEKLALPDPDDVPF